MDHLKKSGGNKKKAKEYVYESEYTDDDTSDSGSESSTYTSSDGGETGSSCSSESGTYTGSECSDSESDTESESESESDSEPEPVKVEEKKVSKKKKKVADKPEEKKKETKTPKTNTKPKKKEVEICKDEIKEDTPKASPKKENVHKKRKEPKSGKHKSKTPSVSQSEEEYEEERPDVQLTPNVSPGQYIFSVISNVIDSGNKKDFKRILSRTPLPIVLHYLHHIAYRAISTGNKELEKVIISMNNKYNIVSDVYIDAFKKGDQRMISVVMDYFSKTVDAFKKTQDINPDDLLKHFTPEFIAMNLIQSGNVESYDSVMKFFKNEDMVIKRGFHTAKPLVAAYFGVKKFFSNQKRYTFNRDILVLAICSGDIPTLDYIVKKTKGKTVTDDIMLEARSCHPITPQMNSHIIEVYDIDEM